jgi:YHS domain-containing protein
MNHESQHQAPIRSSEADARTDPVCGMLIAWPTVYSAQFAGRKYAFCSDDCLDRFEEMPEAFVLHFPRIQVPETE